MDLALNNLQRLICHKTQPTKNHMKATSLTINKIQWEAKLLKDMTPLALGGVVA